MGSTRPIDQRRKPSVAGIDLEQALNYLDMKVAGQEFIYHHYTNLHLVYKPGSRRLLEEKAREWAGEEGSELDRISRLVETLAKQVPWAGYYRKQNGRQLKPDLDLSEEEIMGRGFGWCNEQARLFCCLSQAIGFPSRLVFANNFEAKCGHVMSEAYLASGWMLVEQSYGFCFQRDGRPICAAELFLDEEIQAYFRPIYKDVLNRVAGDLGDCASARTHADDSMLLFKDVGFHNHYLR